MITRKHLKTLLSMARCIWFELASLVIQAPFAIYWAYTRNWAQFLITLIILFWITLCAYYHLWTTALKSVTGGIFEALLGSLRGRATKVSVTPKAGPPTSFVN